MKQDNELSYLTVDRSVLVLGLIYSACLMMMVALLAADLAAGGYASEPFWQAMSF